MTERLKLIILVLACLLLPHIALADVFDDAVAAYESGDYKSAFRGFKRLADKGIAEARSKFASMYRWGKGVPRDYEQAFKWYLKAANQGNTVSQFALGMAYTQSKWTLSSERGSVPMLPMPGVPKDYVLAHMWFNIATSTTHDKEVRKMCAGFRDSVEQDMTPSQIAEAQKLAREWHRRYMARDEQERSRK